MHCQILYLLSTIPLIISTDVPESEYDIPITSSNGTSECIQASLINSLVSNAENLLRDAKKYASPQMSCSDSDSTTHRPIDCFDIYERDHNAKSGIYTVWPKSRLPINSIMVYCDMEEDGGAWTVIQKRGDFESASDYFYRDWKAYKSGFGNLEQDFWLGNDNIFALTNQRPSTVKFMLSDWDGNRTYAFYDDFWIDDELNKYTMHVGGYKGTAGDSFSFTDGKPFTTRDRNNDAHGKNCAEIFKGAWWYSHCPSSNRNGYMKGPHRSNANWMNWNQYRDGAFSFTDGIPFTTRHRYNDAHGKNYLEMCTDAWGYTNCPYSNLNGLYLKGPHRSDPNGVNWKTFRGNNYSLKDTIIKIRFKDFSAKKPDIILA